MRRPTGIWGVAGLLVASAAVAGEAEGPLVYYAAPKPTAVMLLHYASEGQVATGDTSRVLEAFDRVLAERTGLTRARLPVNYAASCDFTIRELCVFQTLFPELDFLGADKALPTPEAAALEVRANPEHPQVVFNIAIAEVRGEKQARFRVFSSTTAAAALARGQAEARAEGAPMDALELQGLLVEEVVVDLVRTGQDDLADPRLYRDVFDALGARLAKFPPRGEITLTGDAPEGATLSLDGRELGELSSAGARILDLPPGVHTVLVTADGYDPAEIPLTVAPGAVMPVPFRLASQSGRVAKQAVIYSGAGVAAAGLGVLIWGGVAASGYGCYPTRADVVCPSALAATSGSFDSQTGEQTGVPLFPIGAGLLATGATWSLGSLLFGEDDEVPWLPLIAGVVLGGALAGGGLAWQASQ